MIFSKTILPKTLIFFLLLLSSVVVKGQAVDEELQSWNDVILNYKFNDKLSHVGDVGARYFFETHWSVFYIRPAIQWHINKDISIGGGVAAFYNVHDSYDNLADLRVFQAVELIWPRLGGFSFHHRVMAEQRWFLTETLPAEFKLRGRYRLGFFTPHYKLIGERKSNYNQFMVEFLDHLDKENLLPFNNFQRYTFIYGHDFSPKVGVELHYQIHLTNLSSGFDIQQHVIRIRLKLNLNA